MPALYMTDRLVGGLRSLPLIIPSNQFCSSIVILKLDLCICLQIQNQAQGLLLSVWAGVVN